MSVSTLSKIAKGDRRVDVDDLVALALALDVSPNWIILPGEASPGTVVDLTPGRALDAERSWLWATKDNPIDGVDVFVSYVDADEAWATWIGEELEGVGLRVRRQASPPPAGGSAAAWVGQEMQTATRTVAVCSAAYLGSHWCTPEWTGILAGKTVIPARVADCTLPPALAAIGWRDLHGLDEAAARRRLLDAFGIATAPRAAASSGFPGTSAAAAGTAPSPAQQPAIWNVQPRLATFTGRQDVLDQIRVELSSGAAMVLHGLGGVGKTQLAVEYCHRYGHDYDLVWWVPAEEPGLVVESLARLAEQVGTVAVGRAKEAAHAAVDLLRKGGGGRFARWLVVLDNADVPSETRGDEPSALPRNNDRTAVGTLDDTAVFGLLGAADVGGGHILVTSRDPAWVRRAAPVEVDVLPRDDAVRLLRARVKDLPVDQASRLAEAVGDLPLALDQAGAWLAESGMPAGIYEDLLRNRAREVLTRGTVTGQVPVAATWTVALDAVSNPALLMLVRIWAHLGPAPIPVDLVDAKRAELLPEPLAGAVQDPLTLGDMITRVSRLGLVRLTSGLVMMHRLVQAVLRDHTHVDEREHLRTAAAHLVAAAVNNRDPDNPDNWPRYAQLYPHALHAELAGYDDPGCQAAVLKYLDYLHARGDDASGGRLAREAKEQWARTLGEEHRHTIIAEGHPSYLLRAQGDYPAARALMENVLKRCERVLADDDPITLKARSCLGMTLRVQGDYPAARALFEDVLSRRQRNLGEDHRETVDAKANLAATMRDEGNHLAARTLFEDVWTRRRTVLGDDHRHTISAAANLAATMRALGDYHTARTLFEEVWIRRRAALGEDHRETIDVAVDLATTLRAQGEDATCHAVLEEALSRLRHILGDNHPRTIRIRKELDEV